MEDFPSAFIDRFTLAGEAVSGCENVYRATEKSLNRQVAVKFISPGLLKDPESRNRFLNEGNALAKVRHQNLVEVFDVDANEERPFIVLQYIDGFSLKEEIGRIGIIPLRHACDYMIQICEGLGAIHREKLVHCNLKPRNIIVDSLGVVKILDFGFVLADGSSSADETDGRVLGTPAYMSPEQARGKSVGVQTDIYAAGVIFFEMVAGSTPFWGSTAKDVMKAHVKNNVPSLRDFNPLLPKKLRAIIYRMLNKDLERRYNTAEKVVRDLNEFLAKDSWQEEVEEARKAFMKQEADRSFKGIKGAIGSSERIKAVRERVDEHIALKKERKAAKVRRSKQRTKVTWLRTGFVCLVLISLMAVVFSDHTSITRIKGMFSKIGIGGVDNLSVSQNGRQIIVEWDTAELTSCQIRLLAPVAQNFYTESNSKFVLHHSCIVEGAFADGATLEFIIIDNDGTESPIYTHIFQYKPLIDKFAIDCGVVTAFVDIATRDVSNCTLNIKSASRGGALLTPVASESTTSQTSSPHSLFFVSQCPAKKHSFSISALPSGKDYIAELKITCPPSRPGAALVVEKSMRKFSTKEPEFTDLFVVPSGKQITATPLVTDNELIFSSDDCFLYSISPGNGNLLWKVSTGTPVAGSPVMENNVIILNLVNGTIMGVNRTDGSVLWSLTTPFPWSQTPALSGNGLMCLISAKGRISIWSISEQKEKSFVETGREINCPPLFADGFIYVVDSLGYLSCRNGSTGLELWNYRTGNKLLATPSVWDKYLFLPAMDSNFYVIYRNRGVVSWRKHLGNSSAAVAQVKEAGSSPGQSEVNILYLIAQSKDITRLVKINAFGGTTLWDVSVEKNLKGTPVISEGRVYAAGTDGVLHCYSAVDGLKLWSLDTGTEISGAPFVTEGYIFVANYKGSIIRIRD